MMLHVRPIEEIRSSRDALATEMSTQGTRDSGSSREPEHPSEEQTSQAEAKEKVSNHYIVVEV